MSQGSELRSDPSVIEDFALPCSLHINTPLSGPKFRATLRWRARAQGRPLPPGPRRLPIIGNIFDVPTWKPWIGFRDLSTRFGPITYLELLGERMVVLSSPATIHDLLVKRAANTADRVKTPLIALVGHDFNLAVMPYSLRWRRHRRMMWQHFHPGQLDKYQPVQRVVTNKFLAMLLARPTNLHSHLR
ncbi:cytochrome P450 [Trametes polyzona]|nr:cytochrome P450 [Trametes polyzona]